MFLVGPINSCLFEMIQDRKSGLMKQQLLTGISIKTIYLSRFAYDAPKLLL